MRKPFLCGALLIIIVVSAAGDPVNGQSGNGITGIVFNEARQPVPNLWIELTDEVNAVIARTRTDSVGRYSFFRLSNGTFIIRIVTSGTPFINQTQRVNLVPAVPGAGRGAHIENIDFYLKVDAKSANVPGSTSTSMVFVQEVPEPARKAYEQATSILDSGKDQKAGMAKLKEAIDLFPTYYLALERLGVEYVKVEDYDPAMTALDKAIEVNSKGYNSYYARGVIQFRRRQYAECVESLRRVVTLAPESGNATFARYYLGMSYLKTGKGADAEPYLKLAAEQGGKSVPSDVHMGLAQIYSGSKRYKEAADELELYLKQTPDSGDADKIKQAIKQLRAKAR